MSHDRGCFRCGRESGDYRTCDRRPCAKAHVVKLWDMLPRENWDFVSMANYKKDMDELGDQAAMAAGHMRRELRQCEEMLGLVVLAAGGEVKVPDNILQITMDEMETEILRDDANSQFIVRVRRKP